jgi:DHA1 family inner membrane transport protein
VSTRVAPASDAHEVPRQLPGPPEVAARNSVRGRDVPVWLSVLALALGGFGIGTTEFASMGVLPDIAGDLGVSIPTAGNAITAYAVGVVVGAPLFAVLGARLPRKGLLLSMMAAIAGANLLSAIAPSFGMLVVARFLSGLPHGAYFGFAAVVASSLVPPERRARAVAMTMTGLTVANIVGVPLTTVLGQSFGWRSTYVTVVVIALLALVAVEGLVPRVSAVEGASRRRELAAMRRPLVWLTLLVGSIGFGGFFAVYSYIAPTLTEVGGYSESGIPVVLALMGLGMTVGTVVGGYLADRSVVRTLVLSPLATIATLLVFTVTAHGVITAAVTIFVLGTVMSTALPALTTRLLDVSGDGKALAATLNHSALNVANAIGAWLGGVVIAAGLGYTAPAVVGAGLAAAGLAVLGISVLVERRAA